MTQMLSLKNVCKSWQFPDGSTLEVLTDLNLDVADGETLAIIGPSGSGKSTLLSLLAGLEQPTTGTIRFQDQEVSSMSQGQLARFRGEFLGIVFQQFHLMNSLTALENVALPLEIKGQSNHHDTALEFITSVGLSHRCEHFPRELSGGECQRVAIARALVTKPKIVLADEPTGNLDPKTGAQISKLLFDLASKHQMTLILVTHNHELADMCQRKLVMRDGKLFSDA